MNYTLFEDCLFVQVKDWLSIPHLEDLRVSGKAKNKWEDIYFLSDLFIHLRRLFN